MASLIECIDLSRATSYEQELNVRAAKMAEGDMVPQYVRNTPDLIGALALTRPSEGYSMETNSRLNRIRGQWTEAIRKQFSTKDIYNNIS